MKIRHPTFISHCAVLSDPEANGDKRLAFSQALVDWYDPTRRPFPWRQSADVFYVTVCEVMLQRTNAEKVDKAAGQLFDRFPTARAVADAPESELADILKPLGLPRRVQHVRQIASAFAAASDEGRVMAADELRGLPGVGPYVFAAVRALVLGEVDAVIDEHVLRIFRRVFGLRAPARRHPTKGLRAFALGLVPPRHIREYNLAILDLGRLVCRPTHPKIAECPLQHICDYANGASQVR